jgi:type IV pilus assembly protein PilM
VDIGTTGIKLAKFVLHASGQLELLDVGFASLEADLQVEMAREAVVATTLRRLLDEKGISTHSAIIALDGHSVFSRLVKLPPVSADKLEQTVRYEAVQNIPFPINEVVWDYQIFDESAAEPEILLMAVKADLVGGMAHAVGAAGLSLDIVDVAPAALANAVRHTYSDLNEVVLVVDIGASSSNLIFIDGTRTFFRTIPVAGGMPERMIEEIARAITFYRNQQEGRPPGLVLLAGEYSGIESGLAERLKLPVEILDPLKKVTFSAGVDVAVGRRLGELVGLAVRYAGSCAVEINLIPEQLRKEQSFRRRQPLMVTCVAVAVLLAGTWAAGLSYMSKLAAEESAQVGARIAGLENIEDQLIPIERQIAGLEHRGTVYGAAIGRRTFWLESLLELRQRMPDGVFLTASKPIHESDMLTGTEISGISYLDKEPEGVDALIELRDTLRASKRFSAETEVASRPTKKAFARKFVIKVFFEEPVR